MLEAIHQSIKAAKEEIELLEQLKKQDERPPLPQELDGVEIPDLNPLVPSKPTTETNGEEAKTKEEAPASSSTSVVVTTSTNQPSEPSQTVEDPEKTEKVSDNNKPSELIEDPFDNDE